MCFIVVLGSAHLLCHHLVFYLMTAATMVTLTTAAQVYFSSDIKDPNKESKDLSEVQIGD